MGGKQVQVVLLLASMLLTIHLMIYVKESKLSKTKVMIPANEQNEVDNYYDEFNKTIYDQESEKNLAEQDSKRLLKWIDEVCLISATKMQMLKSEVNIRRNNYGMKPKTSFWLNETDRSMYCFIPKVGSSTLKSDILGIKMHRKPILKSRNIEIHSMFENSTYKWKTVKDQNLSNTFKFMLVRHPFDRIVSAYRDKAENRYRRPKTTVWYSLLWNNAMRKYRTSGNISGDITFREFVMYLTDTKRGLENEHWRPYWDRCSICELKYDFVGKMESFNRDRKYVLNKLGVKNYDFEENNHRNTRPKNNRTSYESYIFKLDRSLIDKLYKRYSLDFLLFNYSFRYENIYF